MTRAAWGMDSVTSATMQFVAPDGTVVATNTLPTTAGTRTTTWNLRQALRQDVLGDGAAGRDAHLGPGGGAQCGHGVEGMPCRGCQPGAARGGP